jgi:hypothetical protein
VPHVSHSLDMCHGPDWIPGFTITRTAGHFLPAAVSPSPNPHAGLSRSREFHPAALVAAAPALLEACGYTVLAQAWRAGLWSIRSGACWQIGGGSPDRTGGRSGLGGPPKCRCEV